MYCPEALLVAASGQVRQNSWSTVDADFMTVARDIAGPSPVQHGFPMAG